MPGVGSGSMQDFTNMAEKSNQVLSSMGPKIQWVKSVVAAIKFTVSI